MVAPLSVYSVGMSGIGFPQWRYHYQRYITAVSPKPPPEVVVLNYYSGNDATDTRVFIGLQDESGTVDATDYFTYINHQYLVPLSNRRYTLPKLPELYFIMNSILYTFNYAGEKDNAGSSLLINGEALPVCLKHREPAPSILSDEILQQISMAVDTIRTVRPDTQIILSYITTSGGIYGDLMEDCPDYALEMERQEISSEFLAGYAEEQNIHYVDFTPDLREHNREAIVWSQTDHFSPEGYKFYAQLLANKIEMVLDQ